METEIHIFRMNFLLANVIVFVVVGKALLQWEHMETITLYFITSLIEPVTLYNKVSFFNIYTSLIKLNNRKYF